MKISNKDFTPSEIVKIIREWTGLTQKEFGKTISKSERTIRYIENDGRQLSADLLFKIAKIHEIEITFEKKSKYL